MEYENLRGLVSHALRSTVAGAPDAWRDIAFAKLRLGEAGRFIAQSTIQCHGGMGMTEGLQAIRLARRIMMAEFDMATAASRPSACSPPRPEDTSMHPLEKMFRPRSVAVVGASGDPEKLGGRTLLHLKELGYQGRIYPINVSAKEVQGLPAWRSVADLPETPDCALILLPAPLVAQAIDDCAAKGVKFAQVLSSGFAEEGGERRMQARQSRRGPMASA